MLKLNLLKMNLTLMAFAGMASSLQAEPFRCTESQDYCVIQDRSMVIGDKIGVFTDDERLVAFGEVRAIKGTTRKVEIQKRNGLIKRDHRMALLQEHSYSQVATKYEEYRKPSRIGIGGGLGLMKLGVGDGAPGMAGDFYAEYRYVRGLHFVGRTTLMSASGEVNNLQSERLNGDFSLFGFGAMPGVAYNIQKNKKWSGRAEAGIGFLYASATVDGATNLVDEYVKDLTDGFGMYARTSAEVLYRFGEYRAGASLAYMSVHDAKAYNMGMTVSYDFK